MSNVSRMIENPTCSELARLFFLSLDSKKAAMKAREALEDAVEHEDLDTVARLYDAHRAADATDKADLDKVIQHLQSHNCNLVL